MRRTTGGSSGLKEVDQVLQRKWGRDRIPPSAAWISRDRLGELYNRETGLISTDIPMDREQSLAH